MDRPDHVDLNRIEKKVYLAYQNDGIWDILLGLNLLLFGILMKSESAAFMGIAPAIIIPFALNIKKSFTRPRLGYIKFSPQRQEREKKGRQTLTLLLSFTFILGLVTFLAYSGNFGRLEWIRDLRILPFAFVLSLIITACGLIFGLTRYTFYGIFIFLIFVLAHIARSEEPVPFVFTGLIIFIIGLVYLIRFIRRYPLHRDPTASINK